MRNHSNLRRTAAGAAIALTAGLAGAMLVATPAHAVAILVTTEADAFPVPPAGSLRQAIAIANTTPGLDEIVFAAGVEDISLLVDLPTIADDLVIEGSAAPDAEIGIVSPGTTFTVDTGVTFALRNADIDTSNAVAGNGVAGNGIGALYLENVRTLGYPNNGVLVDDGDVSITGSNLSNNGDAGVNYTSAGNDDFFYTTSSDFNNNEYGLFLDVTGGADSVTVQDVEAALNDNDGIYVDAIDVEGTIDLSRLTLHENLSGLSVETVNSNVSVSTATSNDNLTVGVAIRDTNSTVTVTDLTADRNGLVSTGGIGGGLFLDLDTTEADLEGIQTNGNRAEFGGGIGVQNIVGVSTFSLFDADVHDNSAITGGGGGIYFGQINSSGNTSKQLSFGDVRVTGNSAQSGGGGLYVDDFGAGVPFVGGLDIDESTFAGNTAVEGDGGGIHIGAFVHSTDGFPIIDIQSSTISGNRAPEGRGGGLFLDKGQDTLDEAVVSIVNSTVSGNVGFFGGAAWIGGNAGNDDQVRIYSDSNTIVDNTAANVGGFLFEGSLTEFTVYNTILANNSGDDLLYGEALGADVLIVNYSNVRSAQPELAPIIAAGTGNQVGVDPLLGPLADNGGPTLTHLPQPGSPVFDAGDPAFLPPPVVDQRGEARVITRIDMGSVESPKTSKLADTGGALDPIVPLGGALLLLAGIAVVVTRRMAA